MKLGEWIETLSAFKPEMPILFDGGMGVGSLASWRGDYSELTLTPAEVGSAHQKALVGTVLTDAISADGGTFEGWKGGDYTMGLHTPIWADDYGDCHYWTVSGVSVSDGVVIVHRANVADYR